MTREQIERELRERLRAYRCQYNYQSWYIPASIVPKVAAALLPWIMEIVEHARADERISCGELP